MQPHEFWQTIEPKTDVDLKGAGVDFHAAFFDDGRVLKLPIRRRGDGETALASLILNQASFLVVDSIAEALAGKLTHFDVELVVGLPTLGLTLGAALAQKLGHTRYVPLGVSRKFWYREELSVQLSSITTPEQLKRLYVDPRMLPLMDGRRVAVVDDVLSSGASIAAALDLLELCGIEPVAIGAAMLQSNRWREKLGAIDPKWLPRVVAVLQTPLLALGDDGRWRDAGVFGAS